MVKKHRGILPTVLAASYLLIPILSPVLSAGAVGEQSSRLRTGSGAIARSAGVGSPQVTDLSDTGFAVTFTSDDEHAAIVRYGTAASNLNLTVLDDRDTAAGVSQPTVRSTVHRFTLSGLDPGTTYYYEPVVDGIVQTDLFGQPSRQTTAPRLGMGIPSRMHGMVVTAANGIPAPGTVLLV
ncbi:MAG: fibronectin type III domain-containing protein, partial [Chloroflexota bacterium]